MTPYPRLRCLWAMVLLSAIAFSACNNTQPEARGEAPAPAPAKPVTIGYQSMINPWKVGIHSGTIAAATGREIKWRKFNSGAEVVTAMASGDVQVAVAGSSSIATAMSRGVDVSLIWIVEAIRDNEALVARNGSGIETMADLKGKTIGVPFAATTHYHLLVALEQHGIATKDVKILNLQPDAVLAAWTQGSIDATFIWSPTLNKILPNGKVLLTSGTLADAGKPTFDGMLVADSFAESNKDFMRAFVTELARLDADYRDNKEQWTPEAEGVKAIAAVTGAPVEEIPAILGQYAFLDVAAQTSADWLGGGAAQALRETALFLKDQKKISTVLDDYGPFVNASFVQALAEPAGP